MAVFKYICVLLFPLITLGQKRELIRQETTYWYGYEKHTVVYRPNHSVYSDKEITWRDSTTLKIVQFARTLTYFAGCVQQCHFVDLRKYPNDSTCIHITMDKSGETVETIFINKKRVSKKQLENNSGYSFCTDPDPPL